MNGKGGGLVLGGGGLTGIAWEVGVIAGLADAGIRLREADLIVGTSAGSVVGALIAGELPLEEIYASQLSVPDREVGSRLRLRAVIHFLTVALLSRDEATSRRKLGRLALRARTLPEAERRQVIADHVPLTDWPERRLLITAVDAESGDPRVFDRESGVPILDAISASCAVPMVWPTVTIEGRRYMDGGARSLTNADLARGCDRVVVIAPISASPRRWGRVDTQLATLGPDVRSVVIRPDRESRRALGRNVLDPAGVTRAARAGRVQAAAEAARVREVWRPAGELGRRLGHVEGVDVGIQAAE